MLLLAVAGGIFALSRYRRDAPRRKALAVMSEVERALTSSDASKAISLIELSPAAAVKNLEDQTQWIADVLRDLVSAAGLDELRRHGRFG